MDGRVELSESTWRQPWPTSIDPGRLPVLHRVVDRVQALGDRRVRVGIDVAMPNDGVLIVDGVFALRPELNSHWELRVWIDIAPEVSLRRGTTRDGEREGTARAETLHRQRYAPAERLYLAEADPVTRADII